MEGNPEPGNSPPSFPGTEFFTGTIKSPAKGILSGIAGNVDRVGAVHCRRACFHPHQIISKKPEPCVRTGIITAEYIQPLMIRCTE